MPDTIASKASPKESIMPKSPRNQAPKINRERVLGPHPGPTDKFDLKSLILNHGQREKIVDDTYDKKNKLSIEGEVDAGQEKKCEHLEGDDDDDGRGEIRRQVHNHLEVFVKTKRRSH